MKFIKRIGDGEITVKDNQVVDKKTGAMQDSDNWAQEFANSSRAETWATEFNAQKVVVLSIFLIYLWCL